MTTKTKKPRKGSGRWLAWHVSSGATLTSYRENSARPWKHTLKTTDPEVGIREHAVTAALIQALSEQQVLRGVLDETGPYAWNRIVYSPGVRCEWYCDHGD